MRAFDILSTTPFRRLAAKQQVFGLIGDDHSRTRYSHSVETAEIGKRLLDATPARLRPGPGDMETLEAACLLHDIGMPPFGHKGEAHIRAWVAAERPRLIEFGQEPYAEYARFDSNAQGLRLISYHPQFEALRAPAAAAIIAAKMKYPWVRAASNLSKCGILASELDAYRAIATAAGLRETRDGVFERHPLSWIVEIADDVAYLSADVEDAARLDVIAWDEFVEIFAPLAGLDAPPPPLAPEKRGHALWRYRLRIVDRLTEVFARFAATRESTLEGVSERFFDDPLVRDLKAASATYIYARRDARDLTSERIMRRLLQDCFAELAEGASNTAAIKKTAERFRAKRGALAAQSSPLQLTVDLVSEFTDPFALALSGVADGDAAQSSAHGAVPGL